MSEKTLPAEAREPLRLWLVRHGATAWSSDGRFCGQSDIPLSAQGEAQARCLAQHFSARPLVSIYSSDLLRARQTAESIAQGHCSVQVGALWRELAFGLWEGLTYAEIQALPDSDLRFFSDPLQFAPPQGESLAQLEQRVRQAFVTLFAAQWLQRGEVVLVSHAGPLRVLLSLLLHVPLIYSWQFQLAPGSLSALDLSYAPEEELPIASLALLNMQPSIKMVKEHLL